MALQGAQALFGDGDDPSPEELVHLLLLHGQHLDLLNIGWRSIKQLLAELVLALLGLTLGLLGLLRHL
jgi:hypothetical protein